MCVLQSHSARLHADIQSDDFVVFECEILAKLKRTSWKRAADLRGHDDFVALTNEMGHVSDGLVLHGGVFDPAPNRRAAIITFFIGDDGVIGEKSANVLRFAGVEGVEKSGDNGRKFGVYRFSVFDVVSIMSSMARRGVAGI